MSATVVYNKDCSINNITIRSLIPIINYEYYTKDTVKSKNNLTEYIINSIYNLEHYTDKYFDVYIKIDDECIVLDLSVLNTNTYLYKIFENSINSCAQLVESFVLLLFHESIKFSDNFKYER
jgi:hypothetical protein